MSARQQRATRAADRRAQPASAGRQRATATANRPAATTAPAMPPERGLHPAIAVGVLVAITLVGALIDSIGSLSGQDAFNIAVIIGSAVAVLLVRRSQLFWVVVAPPLVYAVIAVVRLYIKRSTSGRRGAIGAIISTVQDYLVFGFPALAGAVALVLVIAGVRVARRR